MAFDWLNPWMLAGLAGIALPVIVHLLSRKRYDVVEWGAMQFLELDPNARRRLRLEDLLLLLLRIGLIALLAISLARPWISGAWVGRFGSHQSRDVAVVLDGSYSMGRQGPNGTPERQAQRAVQALLAELHPGDTVAIFDARDRTRLIAGPTRDFAAAQRALDQLPPPSGTSHFPAALSQAVQLLSRTTNLQRDVIVFTDHQALGWRADDRAAWTRLDELRSLAAIPVRLWAVAVDSPPSGPAANISVDRLQLSREVTVPEMPLRVKVKIRQSNGREPRAVKVNLSIDDERLNDQTLQVRLPEHGEAGVEFEPRFTTPGSHLISVFIDADALPADDRSDAVVLVKDGLPVLLINGVPAADPVQRETFFAEAALSAADQQTPWIRATVQTVAQTDFAKLSQYAVIVLANVATLDDVQAKKLEQLIHSAGRSVLVACGDQMEPDRYNSWFADGAGWFPCQLEVVAEDTVAQLRGIHVSNDSLELPWLSPFRAEQGGTLSEARFSKWWKVNWNGAATPDDSHKNTRPVLGGRYDVGDPWLLFRKHGRGTVAVLTSTLDADWNTLPAKADYVPWLHELLFYLANSESSRNVDVGQALLLTVPSSLDLKQSVFVGPQGESLPAEFSGDESQRMARLSAAEMPGVYRFRAVSNDGEAAASVEYFAVQPDRAESDLTPLSDDQMSTLTGGNRLRFIRGAEELASQLASDSSRAELWWLILYLFLAVLIWEAWLTRRLVRGGKIVTTEPETPAVAIPVPPDTEPATPNSSSAV